jgi:hypothetical protein
MTLCSPFTSRFMARPKLLKLTIQSYTSLIGPIIGRADDDAAIGAEFDTADRRPAARTMLIARVTSRGLNFHFAFDMTCHQELCCAHQVSRRIARREVKVRTPSLTESESRGACL